MPESENEVTATPAPKPPPHPKELSPEYHKAHKQLMLWATILFIWELVGVDLSKAKEAGGYVGPIITALKSPQAIPWVLVILVVYFLIKCGIEWAQCHVDRRRVGFARIDLISGWVVAGASLILYGGQTMSRVQLADRLESTDPTTGTTVPNALLGMLLCLIIYSSIIKFLLVLAERSVKVRLGPRWRLKVAVAQMIFASVVLALMMSVGRKAGPLLRMPLTITMLLIVISIGLVIPESIVRSFKMLREKSIAILKESRF